ncbi:glycoside hydrolase family 30 protein [Agromyces laixinhei]|uniref:glycoside hydrolase family 30 protein n=1 Tax=Agromyces laixinhei TaxID=2585717 RepID=UPI0012EE8167|nr:glycoside hydrolase family 30 beta sandwich domain-containing protein [Agromyces laixinhei]
MSDRPRNTPPVRRRWFVVGFTVLAAVIALALFVALGSGSWWRSADGTGPEPESESAPSVPATATTTSTSTLEPLAAIAVDVAPSVDGEELDVSVDPASTHQTINGFGAALTHSSAQLLINLPDDARRELLEELFAPDGPVRLSVVRMPIGASDFTPVEAFTFDDIPPGETDWRLEQFDLSPDHVALIPVLRQIVEIQPEVRIIASPWSPPAWLKTNGSLEGGRLIDEDRAYDTYAGYLARIVQEYRDAGIDIDYLTVQNEPQLRHPDGYPGADMPVWQAAEIIERLNPALRAIGAKTQILGFDHNWELNPSDAASTPDGEDPAYLYPADLLRTRAGASIAGIAYHCYYGTAEAMTRLWEEFPEKEIWVTECSGSHAPGDDRDKIFADTLTWQSTNLLIGSLRNQASALLTWNLALDENGGPHRGGCETCTGVVTIGAGHDIMRNAEYAVLGQAARHIPVDSVRVDSRYDPELPSVSFRTPDDGTVVLVWNPSEESRPVAVGDGSSTARAELPPRSLTTIEWGESE